MAINETFSHPHRPCVKWGNQIPSVSVVMNINLSSNGSFNPLEQRFVSHEMFLFFTIWFVKLSMQRKYK